MDSLERIANALEKIEMHLKIIAKKVSPGDTMIASLTRKKFEYK